MSSSKDPLELGGLEPEKLAASVAAGKVKPKPPPTEFDIKKEERLQQAEERRKGGPKQVTVKEPVAPPSDVDRMKLLDKLGMYKERFPHLKKRNNVTVKSSVDDILDELHYTEQQLGSKQDGSMGSMLLQGTMVGIESITRDVWNPLGLNLNGLGRITKDNMSEFQPIVDELMIKYNVGTYISPETRLILSLGALVMTVHAANNGDPRVAVALEKMNASVKIPAGSADL